MAHSPPRQESYLVVGGGTFLGEEIVEQLLRRGETRVSIFDAEPLAAEQNMRFVPAVSVFIGNVLDPENIANAIKSCAATCIIHTSMISTPRSQEARYPTGPQPPRTPADDKTQQEEYQVLHRKVNTDGVRTLLAAALEAGVTQLLYIGNADIVFDGRDRPLLCEADAPYPAKCFDEAFEPQSHGERMVRSFNGLNALRTAVIRPAQLFGPSAGVAATLRKIQANPRLAGYRVGENTTLVDRTYTANAAHAALLAADRLNPAHPQHATTVGNVFFIADGEPRPYWDYMGALWAAAGGAQAAPFPVGKGTAKFIMGVKDVMQMLRGEKADGWKKVEFTSANRTYDITLAREVLDYTPIVSYNEGIRRVAEWWLEQQLKLCQFKTATTGTDAPPPYNPQDATLPTEKSPFF